VQLAEGATYAVVPFINRKALGPITGMVGAGGNVGAVAAGFLFRSADLAWADALLYVGAAVAVASVCAFAVRFPAAVEYDERRLLDEAVAARDAELLRAAD
jgi:NNP family nitrate/nitrite transporter-like MFS transporter